MLRMKTPIRESFEIVDSLGDYQVVARPKGYGVIRHRDSGESMHSVNEPADEARRLYVEQSGTVEKASCGDICIVWDVGLGAATNAMELIQAYENAPKREGVIRLISFENDLTPLRLALAHPKLFPHARHEAPHSICSHGEWRSHDGSIVWQLLAGDFLERLGDAPAPEVIWYDPFSYKVNTALWSVAVFREVLGATHGGDSRLFTYSASTAVRASMLCAGWHVGRGRGSGPKTETTIAFTPSAALTADARQSLLGRDWLARWERSDARRPIGDLNEDFESAIRSHPQFSLF
jgi:queuine tRNA-ribosyltransferase